ncbi:MAG: sulfurtransferase [Pseudanabaena sp. ELA607]
MIELSLPSSVVSVAWLNKHHHEVLIIDCRFALGDVTLGRKQYEASHIPGAFYLDLNQNLSSNLSLEGHRLHNYGGRHPLPETGQFAKTLSELGIVRNQTPVIIYDDSRFGFAARLWWLLRYYGHETVAVLDGGWKAWLEAGLPVSDATPIKLASSNFEPEIRADWVVDRSVIQSRLASGAIVSGESVLVDSREPERYRGEVEPIDPVAGSIIGAVNYPWQEVTQSNGLVVPEQDQRWANLLADNPEEIIVYCGSGVTACVNLLSLHLAGVSTAKVKLYAGSWSEWCSYIE